MGANVIDFPHGLNNCDSCPWVRSCVAHGFDAASESIHPQHCAAPLKRNQHLFRQGDPLQALYVLRSGSAKSYFDSSDGLEQIVAFHYPGDLLGFDALASGVHQSAVLALETAALCRIPCDGSEQSFQRAPRLWGEVLRASARQAVDKNQHALLLGQKSAAARFASLLLDFSRRYAARGCSAQEFNLSMPRQDLANYLSLAVETISRLFGELQSAGAIAVDRRNVRILSLATLRAIAGDQVGAKSRVTSG